MSGGVGICKRCNLDRRSSRGDCLQCNMNHARQIRVKRALEQLPCNRCGNVNWTPRGSCRVCSLRDGAKLAKKPCSKCGGKRDRYGHCLTCKLRVERRRNGIVDADGSRGIGERCGICYVVLTRKGRNTSALDHDHRTGRARGWLCVRCNAGLGNFKDNPRLLANAIKYLRKHKLNHTPLEQRKGLTLTPVRY